MKSTAGIKTVTIGIVRTPDAQMLLQLAASCGELLLANDNVGDVGCILVCSVRLMF